MNTSAELMTEVMRQRVESERHRLAYAYHLHWLIEALQMSTAWQAEHHDEIITAAGLCRTERALHLRLTEAEADRRHGNVLDNARSVIGSVA